MPCNSAWRNFRRRRRFPAFRRLPRRHGAASSANAMIVEATSPMSEARSKLATSNKRGRRPWALKCLSGNPNATSFKAVKSMTFPVKCSRPNGGEMSFKLTAPIHLSALSQLILRRIACLIQCAPSLTACATAGSKGDSGPPQNQPAMSLGSTGTWHSTNAIHTKAASKATLKRGMLSAFIGPLTALATSISSNGPVAAGCGLPPSMATICSAIGNFAALATLGTETNMPWKSAARSTYLNHNFPTFSKGAAHGMPTMVADPEVKSRNCSCTSLATRSGSSILTFVFALRSFAAALGPPMRRCDILKVVASIQTLSKSSSSTISLRYLVCIHPHSVQM
mmetsp:Transcript_110654/g.318109  ORF Transcript_110654/g.318109 Transcript_110654/m.318109 type:complete len:338 (-) Transcript_110654:148-1161(-)